MRQARILSTPLEAVKDCLPSRLASGFLLLNAIDLVILDANVALELKSPLSRHCLTSYRPVLISFSNHPRDPCASPRLRHSLDFCMVGKGILNGPYLLHGG